MFLTLSKEGWDMAFFVCPFIFLCFFLFVYIYFTIFAKINTKTCDG